MIYQNPDIESSFKENDLGQTLYDIVIQLKPKRIVEFGALNGYSTVCMAMALEELGRGKIDSYDIWTEHNGKKTTMASAMWNVMKHGLGKFVQFHYGDFWHTDPPKADMYVIDISNDGKVIREARKRFGNKGVIVFEGGSKERDAVEWMKKYKRLPISECGINYKVVNSKFPSISII